MVSAEKVRDMGMKSGFFLICSHQGRIIDGGVFGLVSGGAGFIGHEGGEGREAECRGLGFEFCDMLLQIGGGRAFAQVGYEGEVVVERETDNGAGFETYERAVVLQCLVELRRNADGDSFALGGAGRIAPQGCGKLTVAAVLGIELLEYVGFLAGILGEQVVDVLTEGFGFAQGVLGAAVFDVGEVAYETLFEACDTEAPPAEGAELFVASRNML